jgi:hypothetical protein
VIEKAGDLLFYTYDLGDCWLHALTVYHVYSEACSIGCTWLLEGAMACPPEDSIGLQGMGNRVYHEALQKCARNNWVMEGSSKRPFMRPTGGVRRSQTPVNSMSTPPCVD